MATVDERADLAEALSSFHLLMTKDPRDWSADRHDAFLYGVVVGWGAAEAAVARRHNWDDAFVTRLHRLHRAVAGVASTER